MKTLILLWGMIALGAPELYSQVELANRGQNEAATPVEFDAISFASDSAHISRLDVFIAVPYEMLSFVKKADAFAASYEMTINLYDTKNALVSEKLWTRDVTVPSFDQSVASGSYSVEQRSLLLSPGEYQIVILTRDLESRQSSRITRKLVISDYSKPEALLSDLMLISKLTVKEDGKRSITPSISSNVGSVNTPFHVFFETYNIPKSDSLVFEMTVFDQHNEQVLKTDTTTRLAAGRGQVFLAVDQSSLPIGDYRLFVQAFSDTSQQPLATTNRSFVVRWAGMPKGVKDLDLAIDQIAYIAKDNELSNIREATTPEEKQKRFLEFWKKKDPNPNTVRNERMEEHYARVEYANKNFKHYTEGWRTDMGMVYIIFGTPNNVDRHPFDSDSKPYEVWSYYELNYNFVFVDQTGFGDYRLMTPLWEVWQRPRN